MSGLAEHIFESLARYPEAPVLHGNATCRRERWIAGELVEAAHVLAAGLATIGVERGTRVGLIADNHDLWMIADLACLAVGAVDVPRAADTSTEEILFVLEHSECRYVILQDRSLEERLAEGLRKLSIEAVILLHGETPSGLGLEEVEKKGRKALADDAETVSRALARVRDEDLATIVYTSGTTGNPKGVMLTHGNILHNVRLLPGLVSFSRTDSYLSFLPTWHTFERTLEYSILAAAMPIHYSSKVAMRRDLPRVRPTIVAGVPRVWESLADGLKGRVAREKGLRRKLLDTALAWSERYMDAQRALEHSALDSGFRVLSPGIMRRVLLTFSALLHWPLHRVADRLVYSKLREALGGRIRFIVSGGGALPVHVDEFFGRAGICLLNGYGLTETSPVVCLRDPERNILSTSGRLLPETTWRVMDESGETTLAQGEKGVLWIKGPQVMSGYYKNPSATDAVLRDEWFCSGDLAAISDEGDVVICGRAKDTIVLRGGENVEPEVIEAELKRSPMIEDVIIVGHGEKHLAALLVPDKELFVGRLPALSGRDPGDVAGDAEVGRLLHDEVGRLLSPKNGFRIFERVPRIATLGRGFSVEDGTLTLTMKKRRNVIEERYQRQIRRMFEEGADEVLLWADRPTEDPSGLGEASAAS